MKKIMEKSWKS